MRFGCLGEVMLELVLGQDRDAMIGVAGDTYNTAVYLARALGPGKIDYITCLGADGFSQRIRQHMACYGVGDARVLTHDARIPGLYAIETDTDGERTFTYWRSMSAARCLGDPDLPGFDSLFDGLTHLYYSGISLAILAQENRERLFDAIDTFRQAGGVVGFDSNYRPHLWNDPDLAQRETERAWRSCDIAMPSVDDEMALFKDASEAALLERFATYAITQGALKRGGAGPIGLDGSTPPSAPAIRQAVDTTAAGDSFNAAYLAALVEGRTSSEAMAAGHALASEVIMHKGAIIFEGRTLS